MNEEMTSSLFYRFKGFIKRILPAFLLDFYHFSLAFLAALVYGFPGRKLKVIGITGTSGKSTVVALTTAILEEAGFKVASLSSIRFRIVGSEEINTKRMTLPGRFFVQQFLKKAAKANCQYAVLEITSEGIKQHRHRFIDFQAIVFTNLSPEHIESHGSFEAYRKIKQKLFRDAKSIHILNLDDDNYGFFSGFSAKERYVYGINKEPENKNYEFIKASNININGKGISFMVGNTQFNLQVLGGFNVYNALAAISTAQSQGIDLEVCKKALEAFKGVPGRMEEVISETFKVFVDYAITPNALEKVYQTLVTNFKPKDKKLICIFGSCGGGRDKWKRPVLGQIAAKYCDQIILTNEDPYDESPQEIIDQIAEGVGNISVNPRPKVEQSSLRGCPVASSTLLPGRLDQHQSAVYKIIDRREAINKALSLAEEGDMVIITGKGCEPSMCLAGGKQIPWDDRKVVREEAAALKRRALPDKRYQVLEHRADLKIRVFGKTREELFQNAMLGMFAAADYEPEEAGEPITREIKIESIDLQALLVDFLSQLVYLCETNREVYEKVNFSGLSEKHLLGMLTGRKLKKMGVQIKGVTYHNLEVKQREDYWEAVVLFDV